MKLQAAGKITDLAVSRSNDNCEDIVRYIKNNLLKQLIPEIEKFVSWEIRKEFRDLSSTIIATLSICEWISVKERLPEERLDVLIWGDTGLEKAFLEDGVWVTYIGLVYNPKDIKHWMPMIEPPEDYAASQPE